MKRRTPDGHDLHAHHRPGQPGRAAGRRHPQLPLYNDERVKAVVFGFGAGQELSEHTASMPAVVQFLKGEAALTLGDDTIDARPGTWVHMPAGLRHAVRARTPAVMLLLLLKGWPGGLPDRSGSSVVSA